jgi:hypothetical protein
VPAARDRRRLRVDRRAGGADAGRISAKRLLVAARAGGYEGSDRSFRRAVAEARAAYRQQQRRRFRPWLPGPGGFLVVDWAEERPFSLFCAVLPWSRWRFVRFASDRRRETVLALLAECFEEVGGVPAAAFRLRYYASAADVDQDLQGFIRHYNFERPHRGRRLQGATPASRFYAHVPSSSSRKDSDNMTTQTSGEIVGRTH